MKHIFLFFIIYSPTLVLSKEELAPDTLPVSKKVITINKEAIRAPASLNPNAEDKSETLSEAMEKVEEPKLWFTP